MTLALRVLRRSWDVMPGIGQSAIVSVPMTSSGAPAFGAWSLLSLTATAHGAPVYPDELGVRYVWDNYVPNGRYISPGDLAVIRDNRIVFGAGWIDSIETTPGHKIRYRCPNCTSTDFKHRTRQQIAYRCATCTMEFDEPAEEELTVQVFTANYSRTWRPADRSFAESALDTAYLRRSQQHAIRRLDAAQLRPIIDAHLATGEPWWGTPLREDERIPGGRGIGLSKTRLGQQRFREAMLARYGESCAFTGPQPPGALEAAHLYLYSEHPHHDPRGGLLLRCDPACPVRPMAHHCRPGQLDYPDRPGTPAIPEPGGSCRPARPLGSRNQATAELCPQSRPCRTRFLDRLARSRWPGPRTAWKGVVSPCGRFRCSGGR
jgi:hypothetical protein